MQKLSKEKIQEVAGLQQEMSTLTVDAIDEMAPKATETAPPALTLKERARLEGVLYIEPKRRLTPAGKDEKMPDKLKAEHARAWEYVKGIFENYVVNGEPVTFSLKLYPTDPDYLWEIPADILVYVPRMVASHLEERMKFHTFNYVEKPNTIWRTDDFTHHFRPTGTHYRGKFRPVGAFA